MSVRPAASACRNLPPNMALVQFANYRDHASRLLTADLYGVTHRRPVDAKSDSCTKLFLSSVYIKRTHAFTMLSQSSSRISR
jgi:hypothetical protein